MLEHLRHRRSHVRRTPSHLLGTSQPPITSRITPALSETYLKPSPPSYGASSCKYPPPSTTLPLRPRRAPSQPHLNFLAPPTQKLHHLGIRYPPPPPRVISLATFAPFACYSISTSASRGHAGHKFSDVPRGLGDPRRNTLHLPGITYDSHISQTCPVNRTSAISSAVSISLAHEPTASPNEHPSRPRQKLCSSPTIDCDTVLSVVREILPVTLDYCEHAK